MGEALQNLIHALMEVVRLLPTTNVTGELDDLKCTVAHFEKRMDELAIEQDEMDSKIDNLTLSDFDGFASEVQDIVRDMTFTMRVK